MVRYFKLAEKKSALQFSPEGLVKVSVKGRELCIAKHKNKLFACASKCPHAGGDLSEGYIDSRGNIVCPAHGYKFSLLTGRNVSGEGFSLRIQSVKESLGEIIIGAE